MLKYCHKDNREENILKLWKKLAVCGTAVVMGVGALGSLAGCGNNGGPNHFSIWVPGGEDATFYTDYADNPVAKYLDSKTWIVDGEEVDLDFEWVFPDSSSAAENLSNLISTNTYDDVIDTSMLSSITSVTNAYEEGWVLDLTEYVDKYMPNYKAFLNAHPSLKKTATNLVDGEQKYLQIWTFSGENDYMWGGWNYRRDWICDYGTNPSTGAKFIKTGWTTKSADGQNDGWVDDVYFPSWYGLDAKGNAMPGPNGKTFKEWYTEEVDPNWNGQDPVTLSDWEWMLEIFKTAIQDKGIKNGYPLGMYYPGYYELGDICGSFNGGGPTWWLSDDRSQAHFSLTDDSFREYLIMMNQWYKNGWVNQTFNESNKIFFEAELQTAPQGVIGMWYGLSSQYMDQIEMTEAEHAQGACVYGARQPVNSTYGTAEMKFNIPTMMYQQASMSNSFIITDKAAKKNIPAFLTMMDYLYTEEGSITLVMGLTTEQYNEYKEKTGKTDKLMEQYKNENGDVIYKNPEDGKWLYSNKVTNMNIENALRCSRFGGYAPSRELKSEKGQSVTGTHIKQEWVFFKDTGSIPTPIIAQFGIEEGDEFASVKSKIRNWGEQNIYKYVTGLIDPTKDDNWKNFKRQVNEMNPQKGTQLLQDLLDDFNK